MTKSFVNWKSYFSCDAKCSRIVIDTNLWAWDQSSCYYNNGLRIQYTPIILTDTLTHVMFLRISSKWVVFSSSYIIGHFCQCVASSFSYIIVHFSLQFLFPPFLLQERSCGSFLCAILHQPVWTFLAAYTQEKRLEALQLFGSNKHLKQRHSETKQETIFPQSPRRPKRKSS